MHKALSLIPSTEKTAGDFRKLMQTASGPRSERGMGSLHTLNATTKHLLDLS